MSGNLECIKLQKTEMTSINWYHWLTDKVCKYIIQKVKSLRHDWIFSLWDVLATCNCLTSHICHNILYLVFDIFVIYQLSNVIHIINYFAFLLNRYYDNHHAKLYSDDIRGTLWKPMHWKQENRSRNVVRRAAHLNPGPPSITAIASRPTPH